VADDFAIKNRPSSLRTVFACKRRGISLGTIWEQGEAEAIEKKVTAQSEIASCRKFANSRETDF